MSGRLFVISAPSGTGKTTVLGEVRRRCPGLRFSVSCTTRRPREGEVEGREYRFVTRERFDEMRSKGGFVEWAEVHGELYGTPRDFIDEQLKGGRDTLLDIDVQGACSIKRIYPDAVTIFLLPPSIEELERRLKGRGTDAPEKIALRLANAKREMAEKGSYDHVVVNDDVSKAASELEKILL